MSRSTRADCKTTSNYAHSKHESIVINQVFYVLDPSQTVLPQWQNAYLYKRRTMVKDPCGWLSIFAYRKRWRVAVAAGDVGF